MPIKSWVQQTEYVSAQKGQKTGQIVIREQDGTFVCKVDRKYADLIANAPVLEQLLDESLADALYWKRECRRLGGVK